MDDIKPDSEIESLSNNKTDGYNYRERRHDEWKTNYHLYRGRPQVNRLTQRQSVHIPLMKQSVRTLLKDVDDMPVLHYENLDDDKEAELFKNEYWKWTGERNRFELNDIVDKRQVFIFGRSFDQWQIVDGEVRQTIIDPQDILISRYADPTNIHTSRYLIHNHIFKALSQLESNKDYDPEAIKRLRLFHATRQGLLKNASNKEMLAEKNERLGELGLQDSEYPVLGETIVELSLHFVFRKEKGDEEEQIYLYVEADDMVILMKKPLEEVMGETKDHFFRNHYPYVSWADDLEKTDFWSDSVADIIRPSNMVVNAWYSQLVENRTLRSMGMHYYNSASMESEFQPQTWQPQAFGWYNIPVTNGAKLSDVLQRVDIPDLSESLDEIQFVIDLNERATGATATQQGAETEKHVTLGEVQLALGEAKERIKGMSKFYTQAWKDRGEMFCKLVEAAGSKLNAVRIHKKGRFTDSIYTREITPNDWQSELGYYVRVWSQDEKRAQDTQNLERMNAVKANMPDNMKLTEIYQRKLLEFADISPEDINEIISEEQQKRDAIMQSMGQGMIAPPMGVPSVRQPMVMPGQPPQAQA